MAVLENRDVGMRQFLPSTLRRSRSGVCRRSSGEGASALTGGQRSKSGDTVSALQGALRIPYRVDQREYIEIDFARSHPRKKGESPIFFGMLDGQ